VTPVPDARSPSYAEDRCALRWPLLALGLIGPTALIALFAALGIAVNLEWLVGVAFVPFFVPFLIYISLLWRNWPTGIRIDDAGVQIGAVRSTNATRRTPTVTHQNSALFSCPWPGVRGLELVTDPKRLRELKTSPRYYTLSNRWGKPRAMTRCMLGVLTPPFVRAVLLIEIEPDMALIPELRPAVFFPNKVGRPLHTTLRPETGRTWVVPTRHPEQLREVVTTTSDFITGTQ
jgi:hypothetical protein